MAHLVTDNVISHQVKHQICEATVKAWDKRIGASSMKIYTMYFETRVDIDEEKDLDGFVKLACQKILSSLGYCLYCVVKRNFKDYEYDAEKTYQQLDED